MESEKRNEMMNREGCRRGRERVKLSDEDNTIRMTGKGKAWRKKEGKGQANREQLGK